MTVEIGPLADRLKKAHIIIPIDLAEVESVDSGQEVRMLADGGLELYVVERDTGRVRVFTVNGDWLTVSAGPSE